MYKRYLSNQLVTVFLSLIVASTIMVTDHQKAEAQTAKATVWKFSSYEPPISIYLEVQKWWAREVEKRSGGRLKIKIYTYNELCGPTEMCEAVQSGLADVVMACPAYFPGKMPLGTLEYVPFVTPQRIDHANYVRTELKDHPLSVKEHDRWNAVFGFSLALNSYNIMSRRPLRTVEDFKGLRIRAVGDLAALLKTLGATVVSCPAPDIFTSIERHLFDAAAGCGEWWFSNWKVFDALREKGGYYIEGLDFNVAGVDFMFNKKSYNALPPDIKKILEDLQWEVALVVHEYHESQGVREYFKNKFRAAHIEISTFPPAERAKIASSAPAIWDDWKKRNAKAGSYEYFDAYMKAKEKVLKQYPQGIYKERPLSPEIKKILEKL